MERKIMRKYKRWINLKGTNRITDNLTLFEMFKRFMTVNRTEVLSFRTLTDYYNHFENFKRYIVGDLARKKSMQMFS